MSGIKPNLIQNFRNLISRYKSVQIIIPTPPDIDAVSSSIVLANFLKSKSIEVKIISSQQLPDYYRSIVGDWTIGQSVDDLAVNLIFIIDCPTIRNTGFTRLIRNKSFKLILIDHHPISDLHKIANLRIWSGNWSSTSQGLFYLFDALGELKAQMSTLLYLALIADTGAFQHRVNSETYQVASRLLSAGANRFWVTNFLENHHISVERLKLFGEVSKHAKLIPEWDLLLAIITLTTIKAYNIDQDDDISGLAGFLQKQNLARVIIIVVEQADGRVRGIIRSTDKNRPAGQTAKLFGGDGFDRAGGFII